MRFRPMGAQGAIVSAVSLALEPDPARTRPGEWVELIYAALENGVCAFVVDASDPSILDGLAEALGNVERRLVFLAVKLARAAAGFAPEAISDRVASAIARMKAEYLDALLLHEPGADELPATSLLALEELKGRGGVNFIGVAGEGDPVDVYLKTGFFDLLGTPFNITSGWRERNRLREAGHGDVAVIGYQPYPQDFHAVVASGPARQRRHPLEGVGSYGFLDKTRGWTAEEICLAYALTEPSLASVLVRATSVEHLTRLAAVTDREMPPGLAAQIEMARFSPGIEEHVRRTA